MEKKRIKENKIVAFKNNNNLSGRYEILIALSNSKDRASIEVPEKFEDSLPTLSQIQNLGTDLIDLSL